MAINKILTNSVAADAISEEHLDVTAITGHTELSATAADDDILLVYDASAGTLKKIQKSNVALSVPTFSSVSPTSLLTGDGTGNYTIVITGTKFDANATFKLRTSGGTDISMDSVTRNSSTQLTGTVAKNKANLTNANEPFDIIISNGTGVSVTAEDQINIDAQPVYTTAAGSLGTVAGGSAISTIDIVATDPDSAGNVSFELQSGSLPAGLSSATVNENGVSKFRITGTPTNPGANTTSNFVLRAVDAASNTTSRAFSITVTRTTEYQTFTTTGTFSVPTGLTVVDVLVVGGGGAGGVSPHGGNGGGGAGGLIFFPEYPVTPGGTISVTVGGPGAAVNSPNKGGDGGDSVFDTLTAKGGGGGGIATPGVVPGGQGGSGGGSGESPGTFGQGNQPTQPGNSGAYGFGNPGGNYVGSGFFGSGGGGAGAAGADGGGPAPATRGSGGIGKAYTIADGTTPVYYAGGGGSSASCDAAESPGNGGQGGGGQGTGGDISRARPVSIGEANKGGGGGGVNTTISTVSGDGGKGVVIVKY